MASKQKGRFINAFQSIQMIGDYEGNQGGSPTDDPSPSSFIPPPQEQKQPDFTQTKEYKELFPEEFEDKNSKGFTKSNFKEVAAEDAMSAEEMDLEGPEDHIPEIPEPPPVTKPGFKGFTSSNFYEVDPPEDDDLDYDGDQLNNLIPPADDEEMQDYTAGLMDDYEPESPDIPDDVMVSPPSDYDPEYALDDDNDVDKDEVDKELDKHLDREVDKAVDKDVKDDKEVEKGGDKDDDKEEKDETGDGDELYNPLEGMDEDSDVEEPKDVIEASAKSPVSTSSDRSKSPPQNPETFAMFWKPDSSLEEPSVEEPTVEEPKPSDDLVTTTTPELDEKDSSEKPFKVASPSIAVADSSSTDNLTQDKDEEDPDAIIDPDAVDIGGADIEALESHISALDDKIQELESDVNALQGEQQEQEEPVNSQDEIDQTKTSGYLDEDDELLGIALAEVEAEEEAEKEQEKLTEEPLSVQPPQAPQKEKDDKKKKKKKDKKKKIKKKKLKGKDPKDLEKKKKKKAKKKKKKKRIQKMKAQGMSMEDIKRVLKERKEKKRKKKEAKARAAAGLGIDDKENDPNVINLTGSGKKGKRSSIAEKDLKGKKSQVSDERENRRKSGPEKSEQRNRTHSKPDRKDTRRRSETENDRRMMEFDHRQALGDRNDRKRRSVEEIRDTGRKRTRHDYEQERREQEEYRRRHSPVRRSVDYEVHLPDRSRGKRKEVQMKQPSKRQRTPSPPVSKRNARKERGNKNEVKHDRFRQEEKENRRPGRYDRLKAAPVEQDDSDSSSSESDSELRYEKTRKQIELENKRAALEEKVRQTIRAKKAAAAAESSSFTESEPEEVVIKQKSKRSTRHTSPELEIIEAAHKHSLAKEKKRLKEKEQKLLAEAAKDLESSSSSESESESEPEQQPRQKVVDLISPIVSHSATKEKSKKHDSLDHILHSTKTNIEDNENSSAALLNRSKEISEIHKISSHLPAAEGSISDTDTIESKPGSLSLHQYKKRKQNTEIEELKPIVRQRKRTVSKGRYVSILFIFL